MPASKPQRPAQPAPWIICPRCKGDGRVDTQGVVDPADFDDESREFYLHGKYDTHCGHCKGTGKVREDAPPPILRTGSHGQAVEYADEDDASEHHLRMAEGLA